MQASIIWEIQEMQKIQEIQEIQDMIKEMEQDWNFLWDGNEK